MDDSQIQAIIQRVMQEVGQPNSAGNGVASAAGKRPTTQRDHPVPAPAGEQGLFPTLDEAVHAATIAFQNLNRLPLAIRQDMVAHMRRAGREHAGVLAEMAQQETGMGRVEDKTLKNLLNANKAPGTEALEPLAWSGDDGLTITE